jgi:hypothetical protein
MGVRENRISHGTTVSTVDEIILHRRGRFFSTQKSREMEAHHAGFEKIEKLNGVARS